MNKSDLSHIVELYIEYYNSFKIDEMLSLFTEDCEFQNISNSSGITKTSGKDELRALASQGAQFFSERRQTVTNWIISDDKIALEIDYQATIAANLPNGLKKGQQLNLKGVSVYEFSHGKIKRLVDFS